VSSQVPLVVALTVTDREAPQPPRYRAVRGLATAGGPDAGTIDGGGYRVPVTQQAPDAPDARRRRLLIAMIGAPVLGAALTSCSFAGEAKRPPTVRPDVDARVRWRALRSEHHLIALHAAVAAAHPDLAAALAPLTAHHADHLAVLEHDGPLPIGASGAPASAVPEVPGDRAAALAAVREAERSAAEVRISDCLAATGPRLAAVLSSIGASEAAHDILLETA
jgi:hypothetical protein